MTEVWNRSDAPTTLIRGTPSDPLFSSKATKPTSIDFLPRPNLILATHNLAARLQWGWTHPLGPPARSLAATGPGGGERWFRRIKAIGESKATIPQGSERPCVRRSPQGRITAVVAFDSHRDPPPENSFA